MHSQNTTKTPRIITCSGCGQEKPYHAKGMCARCYKAGNRAENPRNANLVTCSNCGELKPHEAHGVCKRCYHRLYLADSDRAYAEDHREEKRAKGRATYAAEIERQRERSRRRHALNPAAVRVRMSRWRAANPEHDRANQRKWARANREKVRAKTQRRESRKHNAEDTLTEAEWQIILQVCNFRCVYCGQEPPKGQVLEQDHLVPLSRGGGRTIRNILAACKSCNSRKRDRDVLRTVQPMLL